ncbi:hypothetical protein, partial [Streptobacillus moniliformis]
KESFKGELTYTFTPFIDIRKEEGNFRIRAKADSTKLIGRDVKIEIDEGKFEELPLEYFAWNYQKNGGWWNTNKTYNYFLDSKSKKVTKENKKILDLEHQIYNFEIDM